MSPDFFYSTGRILKCFYRINTLITTPLRDEDILQKILDEAVDTMGFHRGIICLLDEKKKKLDTKAVKNYSPEETKIAFSESLNLEKHDCIMTKVAKAGNYIVLEDSEADPRITLTDRKITSRYKVGDNFYSAFCGPLKIKDDIIGIIAMWYEKKTKFPPEVINTLLAFANHASLVIHNSRLLEDNRRKIKRLTILQKAVSQLNSSYALDKIHETVIDNALRIGGADRALLYFLDREKDKCLISTGEQIFPDEKNIYYPKIEQSIIKKAMDTETIIAQTSLRDSDATPIFDGYPSEIAIPLKIKDKFKGVLYLGKKYGDYSTGQKNTLDILITNAAVSYDSSIMHSQLSIEAKSLKTEVKMLKEKENKLLGFHDIIGNSSKMMDIFHIVNDVAGHNTNVLIQGESGTGKELIARAIHRQSTRKSKRFVEINCAAIPGTLLESELFGYESGAFTDARKRKIGLLEHANGGTFLLDEIGEMNPSIQAKFLRMLEDNHIRRLGGIQDIPIDVRFIFSTNKDLWHMVGEGTFREDLFYRINVVPIIIPPLKDRVEDIMPLAYHYIGEFNTKLNKNVKGFTTDVEKILKEYPWPGNVRELKNIIERIMIFQNINTLITSDNIPTEIRAVTPRTSEIHTGEISSLDLSYPIDYKNTIDELINKTKKEILENALKINRGNKAAAARQLGISRYTLIRELKKMENNLLNNTTL
ncbi:MAG: sigma 54-interacting transcriptional regulator [Syntrophobacterales bacterium]|nr:sigma 54-interacting transcriptional regulator [Syntrophobacterales bacterium]